MLSKQLFYRFTTSAARALQYKSTFGQNGKLLVDMSAMPLNITLKTHWEDHTQLQLKFPETSQAVYDLVEINDQGAKGEIISVREKSGWPGCTIDYRSNYLDLLAEIPEYYNYDIKAKIRQINHLKSDVDAKTLGNIKIVNTENDYKGKINLNKSKGDFCELHVGVADLNIKSYLESFQANLSSSSGSITAKRLGVSGKMNIKTESGAAAIETVYVAFKRALSNGLKPEQVEANLRSGETLMELASEKDSNIELGNIQGNFIIKKNRGNITIKRFVLGAFAIISKGPGKVAMHLSELTGDSLIELSDDTELQLKVDPSPKFNIFSVNSNAYHQGASSIGAPTLFIKGNFDVSSVQEEPVKDFFTDFRKRMGEINK